MRSPVSSVTFTNALCRDEHELCARVHAEFREMPGMALTLAQASRLFSLEPERCERVLGALVQSGVLATNGRTFARSGSVGGVSDA